MSGPLDGLVVVALEQAVAAPFATRQLADAGARVIKIERVGEGDFARHYDDAGGPGFASWFLWLNRGKESIEMDLKSPEGQEVLADLIDRADVLVQNLAPGALERLGFDIPTLRGRNPRLVTCSVTGYGPDGPYRDRKAYDLLIQSEAGLVSLTGSSEHPAKAGLSVADVAGGMYAYSNVLLALLQRGITGEGAHIEVSLFDALLEWLGHQVTFTKELGRLPRRAGARHATIAPYGPFPCADGTDVVIAVQNTREWRLLCSVLGLDSILDDSRFVSNDQRVTHGVALDAHITERTSELTSDELVERLERVQLAWGRVNDLFDLVVHPQLDARGRWAPVVTPNGEITMLRPPVDITGIDVQMSAVPRLGEHTDAVMEWLGRTAAPARRGSAE